MKKKDYCNVNIVKINVNLGIKLSYISSMDFTVDPQLENSMWKTNNKIRDKDTKFCNQN